LNTVATGLSRSAAAPALKRVAPLAVTLLSAVTESTGATRTVRRGKLNPPAMQRTPLQIIR
jgi:hypothetical protein